MRKVLDFTVMAMINTKSTECNLFHLNDRLPNGNRMITGFTKQEINIGDELKITLSHKDFFNTVLKVARRKHSGIFLNPQDAENNFFECECKASEKSEIPIVQ